jgi:hypothetical protein
LLSSCVSTNTNTGDVRVQHSWEDPASSKTGVLARPKNLPAIPERIQIGPVTDPNLQEPDGQFDRPQQPAAPMFPQGNIRRAVLTPPADAEEMTKVNTRRTELYRLEIWRNGVRQNVIRSIKNRSL